MDARFTSPTSKEVGHPDWIGHDITVSARYYLQVPNELCAKAAGQRLGLRVGNHAKDICSD